MMSSAVRLQTRRRIIAVAMLLTGLGIALAIYLTAAPDAANPLGYDPADTKQYLRELELYGGKANVIASAGLEWFERLWHGRRLAYTVGCLTVLLLLVFWVASIPSPSPDGSSPQHGRSTGRRAP